jgi:hypothetical protein
MIQENRDDFIEESFSVSKRVATIRVGIEKAGSATIPAWALLANADLSAVEGAGIESSRIQTLHLGKVY